MKALPSWAAARVSMATMWFVSTSVVRAMKVASAARAAAALLVALEVVGLQDRQAGQRGGRGQDGHGVWLVGSVVRGWVCVFLPSPPLRGRGAGGEGLCGRQPLTPNPSPLST